MMKALNLLDDTMRRIEEVILSSIMMIVSFSVIIQVIARYVFNNSIVGIEEVAKFGIVWITFLGTSLCARLGTHISMTAVIEKVPENIKKIMITIISLVSSIFTIYLGILSYILITNLVRLGSVSPSLRYPLWAIYSIAPIAFFTTSIYYFRIFLKNIRNEGIHIGLEDAGKEAEVEAL